MNITMDELSETNSKLKKQRVMTKSLQNVKECGPEG